MKRILFIPLWIRVINDIHRSELLTKEVYLMRIARRLNRDNGNITLLLDSMQEQGLLTRRKVGHTKYITLTEKGRLVASACAHLLTHTNESIKYEKHREEDKG